jgi:hypothetical protein
MRAELSHPDSAASPSRQQEQLSEQLLFALGEHLSTDINYRHRKD